jgi:hypothetical protein
MRFFLKPRVDVKHEFPNPRIRTRQALSASPATANRDEDPREAWAHLS